MSILLKRASRILIQGITTTEGRHQTSLMLEYKAEIVAGVSPGRYGQEVMGVPVYDKVSEALKRHSIDVSIIFVPKTAVLSAALEAINESIPVIIIITGDIPVTESIKIKNQAQKKGVTIIGPGSGGIVIPGETKAGVISHEYITNGEVAIITRTAGNERFICQSLYKEEVGVSAVMSLGGEDIVGTGYIEVLEALEKDPRTEIVVIGGELKGRLEEDAARYLQESKYSKPVIAYLFDKDKNPESAKNKEDLFRKGGVMVVDDIWEIGQIIKESTVEE